MGQIRINADQTYFQIPAAQAEQFERAVSRTAREDGEYEATIRIERAPDTPRDAARHRSRDREGPQGRGRRPHGNGPRSEGQSGEGSGSAPYRARPTGPRQDRPGGGKPFHKKPKKSW